ncbi:MAG: GTP 3',8-cyclase MoaA [Bacteroidota bacterium]|nr:GTP 3',8-cyclase MoaA [Bacteroidota bacterium]MDP4232254.1 GTP 3',8-cyclase MoaA [Bacteroidota bacterium]MDP4242656.1 GTP 3',8-cyclase MoaA [Bacteroidota bacterium]MDP4286782.1 GTP 3',8-cyclase MoaA [Bacteroidota bacterium]
MLIDQYGRVHDYLRIAITDRCNFRCTYCMPEEGLPLGPHAELLTLSEIASLAEIFVQIGVRKIRITGGEPLVRHGVNTLFEQLARIEGSPELALSTNGMLLEEHLPMLWSHGVHQLNISLDTLRAERFHTITGRDSSEEVQQAIHAAVKFRSNGRSFRSVKLNMVVMRGINDDELLDFVRFGKELADLSAGGPALEVRFIEYMPFPGNAWVEAQCVPWSEMLSQIQSEYVLEAAAPAPGRSGPARSFDVRSAGFRIGFITTVSDPSCAECGRLRLTADGMLRTCLFGQDGLNLRKMLQSGANSAAIASAVNAALQSKWLEHPSAQELVQLNTREMISIGG